MVGMKNYFVKSQISINHHSGSRGVCIVIFHYFYEIILRYNCLIYESNRVDYS